MNLDHLRCDRRHMKACIALRIPEEGCRIVLAVGPEGEVWMDLAMNRRSHNHDGP
jgi:hypothetical protein